MKLRQKEFEARIAQENRKLKIVQERRKRANELKQEKLKLLRQELENRFLGSRNILPATQE